MAKGYSYFVSTYKGQYELPQKKSVWALWGLVEER
jgi:hypothetical protein